MTPRILCVGLTTLDLIYRVDRIPAPDEKAQARSLEIAAGGPAANAAITAAALGADVTLVTAIGAHPLGDLIRKDLKTYKVRVIDQLPETAVPPPVSAITVQPAGERTIVSRNAATLEAPPPPAGLPEADLTLVDGHHPLLATAAARSARRLLVDAGTWRDAFTEILPHAEVVACSAAFRHPAQQSPTDEALAAAIAAPVTIVTHGPSPVRWFTPTATGEIPVPRLHASDTAGAGDAFHGALAVALTSDRPLPDAIAFAIRVAGVRVQHAGPRAWLEALPVDLG
ncbi:PfkB family carbohydrate kinase [Paractinoplanes rishiriensis]|uniref:Ribokinase n=1 Tax=Paractinoplanes rishiriensis TaxID=1050105 RepID=A0A919MTT5_9ACTN|nr:PfkB family carbohydrate kinase [Actinoplanes rishiriensis]GIE95078.1 ribokinase [Actinoplanes rishiriensis]